MALVFVKTFVVTKICHFKFKLSGLSCKSSESAFIGPLHASI